MTWQVLGCLYAHINVILQQSRNFALNPGEGLKISAFKHAHTTEAMADRELDKLSAYMTHIAIVDDFRTLKHKVYHLLRVYFTN
jgi:ubiquitin-like domain-containing CTD phosphatase 1